MNNLQLILRPSKRLAILLVITHVGALICLLTASLSWYWQMLGICSCIYSLILSELNYALLKSKKSITHIWVDSMGNWYLKNAIKIIPVKIQGDSYVTPFLTILNCHIEGKHWPLSVVLFSDAFMYEDDFRRLRSYLLTHY